MALGPKPRKYDQKTPKKMIKAALRSALSDRAADGKVIVVDSWGIDSPEDQGRQGAARALGIDGTVLVVLGRDDAPPPSASATCRTCRSSSPAELNAYDVLCNDWIVFTKDTVPTGPRGK